MVDVGFQSIFDFYFCYFPFTYVFDLSIENTDVSNIYLENTQVFSIDI